MVAESCRVAFTNRQWKAYQFVLDFHRSQNRTPTAAELGRGLRISLADSAKLIGVLTAKGILRRRVSHVLAIVPPNYNVDDHDDDRDSDRDSDFAEDRIDRAEAADLAPRRSSTFGKA